MRVFLGLNCRAVDGGAGVESWGDAKANAVVLVQTSSLF